MISIFGVGRVGNEPELRYTPSGAAVVNVSVACDVGFGEYKTTQWVRVTAFGGLAEAIKQYVTKGMEVSFIGAPQPDKDTGSPKVYKKKDGSFAAGLDVKVTEFKFGGKSGAAKPEEDVEF